MSTYNQDVDLVNGLKVIMLGKLRANRHKEHWRDLTIEELLGRIDDEVNELKEAILLHDKPAHVALEAADVAIFCAMLIDNLGEETE